MTTVKVSTVRFSGVGQVDCRKCGQSTVFPDSAAVVILTYGNRQDILSADGAMLHQCGRTYWRECEDCGEIAPLPELQRPSYRGTWVRRLRIQTECETCGGRIVQRSTSQPQLQHPQEAVD